MSPDERAESTEARRLLSLSLEREWPNDVPLVYLVQELRVLAMQGGEDAEG